MNMNRKEDSMLGIFKKKKAAGYMLGAPAKGKAVEMK